MTFNAFRSGGGKVPTLFGSRIGRGFEHEVTSRGARVAQAAVGRAVQPAGRGAVRSGSSRRKAASICLSHSCSTSGQEFCARSARSSSGTRPRTGKEGPALGWPPCHLPAAAPWRAFTHPVGGTCGGHRGDTVSESGLARPCTAASARPSPAAPRVEAGGGSHSGAGGARGGGARRPALKPPVAAEDSVPAPDLGADSGRRVSVQRLLLTLVWLVPGDQEFNSRLADSPEVWLLAFGSRCELVSAPAERPVFGDFPMPLPAGGIAAGFTLDSFPGLTQM